ncbi:glycoside hydrolase superfamily [Hyaloraphidium curvatum]|nr:glycoside hydrolase superfamily [Hyaloraphidium curvatum]
MSAKSRQAQRRAWRIVKAVLAITLSLAAIAGISYRISQMHKAAVSPVFDPQPNQCAYGADPSYGNYSRLEPPIPVPYLGMSIDWQVDGPYQLDRRVGRKVGVVGGWVKIFDDWYESEMMNWMAQVLAKAAVQEGGQSSSILLITLMPEIDMDRIEDKTFTEVADQCAYINLHYGVPILLRFAHEMNGNWNPYGQKPIAYRRAWRRLVPLIRARTNLTATMWAPNMGENYPYTSTPLVVRPGDAELAEMDTNGDGFVDVRDDPYSPYYPGDDLVDWVGMSVYWFGQQWPETLNLVPPPQRFVDVIRGQYRTSIAAGITYDFYARFSEGHSKPMAIPESGAVFYSLPVAPGDGQLAIKEAWWRQVYNTTVFAQFPRLKLVSNFEESKVRRTLCSPFGILTLLSDRRSRNGRLQ